MRAHYLLNHAPTVYEPRPHKQEMTTIKDGDLSSVSITCKYCFDKIYISCYNNEVDNYKDYVLRGICKGNKY